LVLFDFIKQYQRLECILSALLLVVLFVLILDLAISKGMYKTCIVFIQVIVSIQLLRMVYLYFKKQVQVLPSYGMLIAISIPIIFIMLDSVLIDGISQKYYIKNLKIAVFIILAIWMIPIDFLTKNSKLMLYSLLIVLLLASGSNFIAVVFYSLRRIGLTSNPHYLALQAILIIPVAIYLLDKVYLTGKVLLIAVMVMEFYLLMESFSRTAWIAFLVGASVSIPFLSFKTRLWAAGMIFLIPLAVYYFGVLGVDERLNDLINNLVREERVTIWSDALAMQQGSNWFQWLVGHGLGSFELGFQTFSHYHGKVDFTTPHNFFIEILYTSGIAGLLMIVIGEGVFVFSLLKLYWNTKYDSQKVLVILVLVLLVMLFIHTFLTISFFAKQSTYFLAMIIGLGFYLFKREKYLMGFIHGK